MKIKNIFLTSMLILCMAAPFSSALASGIAVIQSGEGDDSRMEIEYLNKDKVRMNVNSEDGDNTYMLVRDGKSYIVSNAGGRTMVMDVAQLGGMAQGMGMDVGATDSFKQELLQLKPTGKSEIVAGYEGDVYSMTWKDDSGTHTEEAVLSGHKHVREFSDSWMSMAEIMSKAVSQQGMSDDSIMEFLKREGKGILRLGKDFHIVSIESKSIPASRFDLPVAPMQMPSFGGMGNYQYPAGNKNTGAPTQNQMNNAIGGALQGIFGR